MNRIFTFLYTINHVPLDQDEVGEEVLERPLPDNIKYSFLKRVDSFASDSD